jgi:hypothetical protein
MTSKGRNVRQLKQALKCPKKRKYKDQAGAEAAIERMKASRPGAWDAYKCLACDAWHVGSRQS